VYQSYGVMSLIKIPFIILATWGISTSARPPNPPPPQDERYSSVPLENSGFVQWGPMSLRVLQFVVCAAEISTILASANPSSPLSKLILSLLLWNGGKPDNLYMSKAAAIGLTLIILGTWIRLMTFHYLGRFFRFEASIQKDHELIVSGPYSVVRHPSYTGAILILGGWFPWHLSKGSWIMESGLWNTMLGSLLVVIHFSLLTLIVCFALTRMSKEDIALRSQFGKKWYNWAKRVPYSIFPGIY